MKSSSDPGKVIDQAYKIIQRTYQEINAMKDDFASVLKEIDPRIEFSEEYSYGPKSLHLKKYHIFLFERGVEEEEESNEEFIIGIVILFSTDSRFKKLSSIDGPEIWICKMRTRNIKKRTRPWHIAYRLRPDERSNFVEKNIEIGGKVYNYHWKDEEKDEEGEEWVGKFIGYPLTDIKDNTFIKEQIIAKLEI